MTHAHLQKTADFQRMLMLFVVTSVKLQLTAFKFSIS